MDLFLGNKNKIGVEIKVTDRNEHGTLMGYARLWLGGHFLGTFYDYIYLDGYLLGGLFQILKTGELRELDIPADAEARFNYFQNLYENLSDPELDLYRVSFGTLTDNFTIWPYKEKENITILWKITNTQSSFEDLINYPTQVFSYTVKFEDFKEFVERLDRILKSW